MLPLSVPALAAFAIFQFLWVWNDYLVASTFLGTGSPRRPMTVRLATLSGGRGQDWHLLTAAAFVSIALPLAGVLRSAALLRAGPAGRVREGISDQGGSDGRRDHGQR